MKNKEKILAVKLDPACRRILKHFFKDSKKSLSHKRVYESIEKQVLEPYLTEQNKHHNFALSIKQKEILKKNVNSLSISKETKEKILKLTQSFYTEFKKDLHAQKHIKNHLIFEKGKNNIIKTFEKDIDKLFTSYTKEFPSLDLEVILRQTQLKLVELLNSEINPDCIFNNEGVDLRTLPDKVIHRFNPSNRPTFPAYDRFLYELSIIIKDEKHYYIPIIVTYLKSFTQKEFDIFRRFEINNVSIRRKLSKYRQGMTKDL